MTGTTHVIRVRLETPADAAAIRLIHELAFSQPDEADIVDQLRRSGTDLLSLVADDAGTVLGHVLFTPAQIDVDQDFVRGMALGPMAVHPDRQRRGVGSSLISEGLQQLRNRSCPFVVVVGHPEYYPRFGFEPASRHGVSCQWSGVPDEAF